MRIFHLHSASIPGAVGLLCRFCHIGLVVGRVGRALGQRDQRPGDQIININILVIAPPNDAHRSARNIEQRNVDHTPRHDGSSVRGSERGETGRNAGGQGFGRSRGKEGSCRAPWWGRTPASLVLPYTGLVLHMPCPLVQAPPKLALTRACRTADSCTTQP